MYDRITSPFYGTLILSWVLWNWKIIYLLFWEVENISYMTKIDIVQNQLYSANHIVWYPIISTITILTVGNFVSNGAFWINLKFEHWKIKKRQREEGQKLLTLEESIRIKAELDENEQRIEGLLSRKDIEINNYKSEISGLKANVKRTTFDKIVIVSDEDTIFISSPTFPDIPTNKQSFCFRSNNHHWRATSDYYELKDSHWIAHSELIEDIEAENGGIYKFQRTFELPFDHDRTIVGLMHIIVDDHCEIKINNISMNSYSGFIHLHSVEVTDYLRKGNNTITFDIQNNDSRSLKSSVDKANTGKKGKINPYGFKYKLIIYYLTNTDT